MIGSGGTKRVSSRYTATPAASYYPLCGLLSYPLVVCCLCGWVVSRLGSAARLAGYGELRRSGEPVARQTRPQDTHRQDCAGRRGQIYSARQYWQPWVTA